MAEIGIRKAAEHDAAAIDALLRDLGWFGYLSAETAQDTEQWIRQHIALCNADDSHFLYVAESLGGEVVGYASITEMPTEEVARQLVLDGWLQEEPSPALVADMLDALEAEEGGFEADELSEEGNST